MLRRVWDALKKKAARGLRKSSQLVPSRLPVAVEKVISLSPRASATYLALSGRLVLEGQAVLSGQLAHAKNGRTADVRGDAARYTLRRNVHRLEKGLIMRPRRAVFAGDYIGETLRVLGRVLESRRPDDDVLLQWAWDVLGEYFAACSDNEVIAQARARYAELHAKHVPTSATSKPYARGTWDGLPSYEQMLRLALRRRSVRWFQQRPVERELVDRALEVGIQAPSACNRQPFRFIVLDEPELVKKVARIPMGTAGFSDQIPMLIVVLGQLRAFAHERDRHLIYIDSCLAIMGFELALETLGLSSCSINWPAIEDRERAIRKVLDIAPDEQPIMTIAVGYADETGEIPFSQKKPLSVLRSYNQ